MKRCVRIGGNDLIPAPLNDRGWHVDLCDSNKGRSRKPRRVSATSGWITRLQPIALIDRRADRFLRTTKTPPVHCGWDDFRNDPQLIEFILEAGGRQTWTYF